MSGGHAESGGKKPGALRAWWEKGKKGRKERGEYALGRFVKHPLKAIAGGTVGNISRAKKDFYNEHGLKEDPSRGILETTSYVVKIINERIIKTISTPVEAVLKTIKWAAQTPGRAVDNTVRAACRLAGTVPGVTALLLSCGIIGEQSKYGYVEPTDETVCADAKGHDKKHGAEHEKHGKAEHDEHTEHDEHAEHEAGH